MRTFILSLLLLTCSSFIATSSARAEETRSPVRIALVEFQPIVRTVSTYGVLAPKIEHLSFRINGRIASFNVTGGETVEKGQVLAELEKRDARDRVNQARVQKDQNARQLERFRKLAEDKMIQRSQLENAIDAMETASIRFDQALLQLERSTLIAPARGVILEEHLDSKTTVTAGTPIYSFRDISESWVTEVKLTDTNAFVFGPGTKALARFAPYPGVPFQGTLTKQAGVADENDGLYTVEVTIANEGRELRPGMVVEIDLVHETSQSVSMVPLDAIVDVRGEKGIIYLLNEPSGTVSEQSVHIIAITAGKVALVEQITAGTKVVVRGQQSLRDNSKVRVL